MKAAQVIEKKNVLYSRVFNTQEGKQVLEDLVALYLPDKLSTDSPHTTAIRVGESNPIRYILRRVDNGVA